MLEAYIHQTIMLRSTHILFLIPCIYGLSTNGLIVETKQGLIKGLWSDNGDYSMFLGIPYGKVDEANPFGPSVPHVSFNGTFEAFDDSAVCPQISIYTDVAVGTIDCLRLNVYVPNQTRSQELLPVMVWLHCGGFIRLSGNRVQFAPDFLIKQNVIIVSINFRLGPYGFLCLDIPTVSGNQGLKDQFLALKWVNENIQSFGGDAKKVTVFGESSGAKSIHLHLLSGNEKLFHKAIIQSGVAVTPLRLTKPDNTIPLRIADKLGFKTQNLENALTFLASQHTHLVTEASKALGISIFNGTILPETRPCIEKQFEGSFITDYPFKIRSTMVKNMPIMFGYNSQEMLYKFGNANSKVFDAYSFRDRLKSGVDLIDDDVVNFVKHFYIGDANLDSSLKDQILNFESDYNFNHPTERTIKRYMKDGAKPVYFYVFNYEGGRNYMKVMRKINRTGASHVDELGYLFKSDLLQDKPSTEDQKIIDTITTLWTNFAKYGDPTPEISELLPVKWLPVNDSTQNYLKIDSELSALTRPFQKRMAFWDLFYKFNGESQDGAENDHTEL